MGNRIKQTVAGRVFDVVNVVFMFLLMLVTLYPFWYVAVASVSDSLYVLKAGAFLVWPVKGDGTAGFVWDAYKMVLGNPNIGVGFRNTLMYVVLGSSINMIMTVLTAYPLSRRGVFGIPVLMKLILFTMFFSGGLIPSYLLIRDLDMLDSIWAIVLPGAISTYNLIIMRTSFAALPESLVEAARIDGANDLRILWQIVIPLSLPVISVILLYYAVGHWNSWFSAVIYLRTRGKYPLQIFLREILISNDTQAMIGSYSMDAEYISETLKYATTIVVTVPILVVYPFLQRYFVKGVMIGSVKE